MLYVNVLLQIPQYLPQTACNCEEKKAGLSRSRDYSGDDYVRKCSSGAAIPILHILAIDFELVYNEISPTPTQKFISWKEGNRPRLLS
jgi:hypothetical protein